MLEALRCDDMSGKEVAVDGRIDGLIAEMEGWCVRDIDNRLRRSLAFASASATPLLPLFSRLNLGWLVSLQAGRGTSV